MRQYKQSRNSAKSGDFDMRLNQCANITRHVKSGGFDMRLNPCASISREETA